MRAYVVDLILLLTFRCSVISANGTAPAKNQVTNKKPQMCFVSRKLLPEQQQQCSARSDAGSEHTIQEDDDEEEAAATAKEEQGEGTSQRSDEEILDAFRVRPTAGQHLMLVRKNSPYGIQLDETVAHRLRQSQQVHNTDKDDLMHAAPWERRNYIAQLTESSLTTIHDGDPQNQTLHDREQQREYSLDQDTDEEQLTVPLLLKSHPGRAIVATTSSAREAGFMLLNQQDGVFELGIGGANKESPPLQIKLVAAESSEQVPLDSTGHPIPGKRYVMRSSKDSGGAILAVGADLMPGSPVVLMAIPASSGNVDWDALQLTDAYLDERCHFMVHEDGTVSPTSRPTLRIGISPVPAVHLVDRHSPNRLLFQHARQFWSAPAPAAGVLLELASHPGLAVVPVTPKPYHAHRLMAMQELGVGPSSMAALRLFSLDVKVHHHFRLTANSSHALSPVMVPFNLQVQRGHGVRLLEYTADHIGPRVAAVLWTSVGGADNATWVVNEEGSISPLYDPSLVLGCDYVAGGQANEMVTKQQQILANTHATLDYSSSGGTGSGIIGRKQKVPSPWLSLFATDAEALRFVHSAAILLFVEGLYPLVCFLFLVVVLVIVELVPFSLWVAALIHMCFDGTMALLFLAFHATALSMLRLVRSVKAKRRVVQGREAERRR